MTTCGFGCPPSTLGARGAANLLIVSDAGLLCPGPSHAAASPDGAAGS
jgi:hypothetical protein